MATPQFDASNRSVIDRTLSVLAAFDRAKRNLTLSDISRRSGLPVATVHRIVNKLHGWGALERCASGEYSIGLRLWETAALAPRASGPVVAAHPYLVELHEQTSAATTIAIRDGGDSVCLSLVSNDRDLVVGCGGPGFRAPLKDTAAGLVLLAHASVRTPPDADAALKRRLAKVRREGFAVLRKTLAGGRDQFAVPVRDSRGAVFAAVGVLATAGVIEPVKLAPRLRAAADAVSRCLETDGGAHRSL